MKRDRGSLEGHPVVSREAWLSARTALLAKEKEFTRLRDDLSRQRRELPLVKVDKAYVFDGPSGKEPQPARRLSLHVQSHLGRGMPALLVLGRQLQPHRRPPESPRRDPGCHLPGPPGQDRVVQEADGMEL